jgi:hypothetical protein
MGMRVAGGSTCFPGLGDDFGVFRGSCEKKPWRGVSCGADGFWVCTALDLNQLRDFGSCAFLRANGAVSSPQGAHRHIPKWQSAHSWDFQMSKCRARSAHKGKAPEQVLRLGT